jgi:NUP50 (Nucleoporin 50 kDa)
MKRTAERQITKDDEGERGGGRGDDAASDADADAAPDHANGDNNYRASAEVMARRRIVRAKRNDDGSWKNKAAAAASAAATAATSSAVNECHVGSNGDANDGPAAAAVPPPTPATNPFAGIQLVASAAPATAAATSPATDGTQEEPTKVPPKKAASIFGSTSGFSGFGSVAKASGFAGFSTLPATTGGGFFGSAAATAAPADGGASAASTAKSSVFGGLAGFSGFAAAAANTAAGSGGGFTFGKPGGTTDLAAEASSKPSPSSKENKESGEGEGNGGGAAAEEVDPAVPEKASPQPKQGPQLPTEYELVSGEESEKILLELRCRTYRWGPQQLESDNHKAGSDSKATAGAILSVPPSSSSSAFAKDESPSKETGEENKASSSALGTSHADASQPACKWHEAGIGPLRILLNPTSNALRLVQRRESTINGPATKVVWNVSLWKESVVKPLGDRHVQISSFLGRGQPVLILCKCATPTNAADLLALLESRVPNLRSAEATATEATKATTDTETTETASEAASDVPGISQEGDAT